MKNSFLFVLALAIALLANGCTKTETVQEAAGRAITFGGGHVGLPTRAPAPNTTLDSLKMSGKGFYVFGAYNSPGKGTVMVFDGKSESAHVTWNVSSWGYSPISYWIDNVVYKFAAYAPALRNTTRTFDYDNNSMTFTNFVSDGKTDLLVAAATRNGINGSTPRSITLPFRHALSKVRFTIKNGWRNNVTMSLREVKIDNMATQGNLTTPDNLLSLQNFELSCWTGQSRAYHFLDEHGADLATFDSTYVFEHFMIPQTISENQLTFSFDVTVQNSEGGGPDLDGNGGHTKSIEIVVPVDEVSQWSPCHAYNYVLTISGESFGLKPIQFETISVEDWIDNDKEPALPQP